MRYSEERLTQIFNKTSGQCHLCHEKVAFCNDGIFGTRGAWQVEHSIPKALGGTDHLNNLYPAHIRCNQSKGIYSTKSTRSQYGRSKAPLSVTRRSQKKTDNAITGGLLGGILGGIVAGRAGFAVGATIGAKAGYDRDPDW